MFEAGLVALITGDAATAALIGTRLYPVTAIPDEPTYPYVTYQDITGSSDYTFEGAEDTTVRIQFDIWVGTPLPATPPPNRYKLSKSIIIALRNLLSGYVGTLNDGTYVLFALRLNPMDKFDNDQRAYRSIVEYEFLIAEA